MENIQRCIGAVHVVLYYRCVLLSDKEVWELNGLEGFRRVNHRLRKEKLIDLARRHFPPGGRIADVGCGAGDIAMELQALGFKMTGVEFEPVRLKAASDAAKRHKLDVRFVSRDLTKWEEAGQFEGLIMGEILEHFSQPREILESHLERVVPGGKILVTVPNMASLRARLKLTLFGEFADHNPEHLYYFTRRRFIEHFRDSPVEILELFTFLPEITLSSSRLLARTERLLLQPVNWLVPSCGSQLVAVLRKKTI